MDDATWSALLDTCARTAGDPLSECPEGWELCLLAKVAAQRFGLSVRKLEMVLLEAETLEQSRQILHAALPKTTDIEELLARAERDPRGAERRVTRSRSRRRQVLGAARAKLAALRVEHPAAVQVGELTGRLLLAGKELLRAGDSSVGAAALPAQFTSLRAPVSVGPPAFFPVGNAAGRFLPLTSDLSALEPRLLFVGLSDLRHLFVALEALEGGTRQVLQKWIQQWRSDAGFTGTELQEVLQTADLSQSDLAEAAEAFAHAPCVFNLTLQHTSARLQYNLHSGQAVPSGWQDAGDGVLLWPPLPEDEEFDPDAGAPGRAEYLGALTKLLPRSAQALAALAPWGGSLRWSVRAGDCLALRWSGKTRFERVFTSNVADHVGVVNLVVALVPVLEVPDGRLEVCLSNNLKALDLQGDIFSLFPKLYNLTVEEVSDLLGIRCESPQRDQLWIYPREAVEATETRPSRALVDWLVSSTGRLYRCPSPDPETLLRRRAHGDVLGMALRFLRRFTCSKVMLLTIASLLKQRQIDGSTTEAEAALKEVLVAAPFGEQQLALLLPELQAEPRHWRLARFRVATVPSWAWRARPTVVLAWARGRALSRAKQQGVRLQPQEPMWPKCRREAQVEFLRKEVWGHLKWFLKSPEVQVIEAFDLHVQDGCLVVTFPLESFEVDFGLGGAAFLVSAIDNVIVTGPHGQEQLEIVDGEARKED
ncbi:unnamed protein product [Durusdinium trenchii]|uniref:Uncharacterized protein n=1 Tax=Durusdinium trenchii TaxID=1381693 RepID=A0ABP0Q7W1_9DINO